MYKNIYKNTCLSVYFLDDERSSWPQHLRRFVEKILQTHQIALVFCRRRIQDCLLYCDTTSIKKSFKVHAYLATIKSQQQNHHRLNKAQLYSWFGFLQAIAAKSKYDDEMSSSDFSPWCRSLHRLRFVAAIFLQLFYPDLFFCCCVDV